MPLPDGTVAEADIDDFGELGELDIVEDDEGAIDLDDSPVVDPGGDAVVAGGGLRVQIKGLHGH